MNIPDHILKRKLDFLSKIEIQENQCWDWVGSTTNNGYGYFGRHYLAHRVSYAMFVEDPTGFLVCHRCDRPICVSPEHLFIGTHKDNTQDMIKKRRGNLFGLDSNNTEMTKEKLDAILKYFDENKISVCELAKIFNLSFITCNRWLRRSGRDTTVFSSDKIRINTLKAVEEYVLYRESPRKLAKKHFTSAVSIYKELKRQGIKVSEKYHPKKTHDII